MSLSQFIITFTTYYTTSVTTTISVFPTYSSNNIESILTECEELISYIENNGISNSNRTTLTSKLNSLKTNINSSTLSNDIKNASSSITVSDVPTLVNNLNVVKESIQNVVDNDLYDKVLPNEDTENTPNSSITIAKQNKNTYTGEVIDPESLTTQITNLKEEMKKSNTSLTALINTLKTSISSMSTNLQTNSSTTNKSAITVVNNILGKQKVTKTNRQNNVFSNLVNSILFDPANTVRLNRSTRRRTTGVTTTTTSTTTTGIIPQLSELNTEMSNIPKPTTTSSTTTKTVSTTDYYIISTSLKNNSLCINYSYFEAGSSTSSKNIVFYLSPKSLIYISMLAYKASKKLTETEKQQLCEKSGLDPTNTSQENLWCAYLICIFSFLSMCVSSQLYDTDKPTPTSLSELNSYNYMLDSNYLDKVGNYSINLQTLGKRSDVSSLMKVGIPGKWSQMMFPDEIDGTTEYQSSVLVSTLSNI